MSGSFRLTFVQALGLSLVIHTALAVPFVAPRLFSPPEEPPTLVIDLQGIVADEQDEAKILEQVKGAALAKTVDAPPLPPEQRPRQPEPENVERSQETTVPVPVQPPAPKPETGADKTDAVGAQQQQIAQAIKTKRQEAEELSIYVKGLSKKIRSNLSYRNNGRRSSAVVSFTILADGNIRSDTLKIVRSTGQPKLDTSALQTIRASAPFDRPLQELNVAVVVDFERR
ncbi:TonB family protein [Microbacteriaceae bacterium K1510]|nr:TonB family protein [Microbacteriaceae bacterium K1510]